MTVRHEWARFRGAAGFTQESIAEALGVTRFFIINLEKALYERPPGGILRKLSQFYGKSELELLEAYKLYVKMKREEFSQIYPRFQDVRLEAHTSKHPLVYYREINNLSRAAFCKGLCLHPKTIEAWEKNKQRGIPVQLIVACSEIGWDYGPLENAVSLWRSSGYADRKGA